MKLMLLDHTQLLNQWFSFDTWVLQFLAVSFTIQHVCGHIFHLKLTTEAQI